MNKGVKIHTLNMELIKNTPMGRLIVTNLYDYRANPGPERLIAKQKPDFKEDRPRKFNSKKITHTLELLQSYSYRQLEEMTGISKSKLIREKRKHIVLES